MSIPNPIGFRSQIQQVHIADGFADDCEELIHRWIKTDTLTFETFCELWKDMQFDMLYHGRSSGTELAELSEELIQIAKHYMVSNPDNFEESVGGLFLVYGLINLQPYPGFATVRFVPEDVYAIKRIETMARASRRKDVLYILGSVLIKGPVQYHAAARERGMEAALKKYAEGTTGIDRMGVRPKGVFFRQNEELDLLRELNHITRRYAEAKKAIPGNPICLNYVNEKLATELDTSLKGIINGIVEEGDEANKKISEHYSTVQAIKDKAMRQGVEGVKFLVTTKEKVEEESPAKENDEPKKKEKVKTDKPAFVRKKYKKRCFVKNLARKTRKRKRESSSSDSNSPEPSPPQSDGSQEDTDNELLNSPSDSDTEPSPKLKVYTDLNLEAFTKAVEPEKTDLKEADLSGEKEINIEIDRIPIYITEQDGKFFQIEIIDEKNESQPATEDSGATLSKIDDVSITKINPHGEGTSKDSDSEEETVVTDKEMKKKANLKKPDKKELKNTKIRSKFKRLGLLHMTNFEMTPEELSEKMKNKRGRKKIQKSPQ
ncbi:snRNA-activating protein complex subunit 1 isoform X1 [Ostrinia furnacalis]|uniref:snRNA-activating protein complex subunit 1 isoform X1 n=1 Tax=Ostrinia furnacalis TaxID=93504 RepID=UPI00103E5098|nr:snRNA-activating protein complex subunit 1 isoform X1 [Ostrinia furnacalis]